MPGVGESEVGRDEEGESVTAINLLRNISEGGEGFAGFRPYIPAGPEAELKVGRLWGG